MCKHEEYLEQAFNIAQDIEPFAKVRIVAFLVYKDRVIGTATNRNKSHPITIRYGRNKEAIYPHAEVAAINRAKKRFSGDWRKTTLYIARARIVHGKWSYGLVKPCLGCWKALRDLEIGTVIWTKDHGYEVWQNDNILGL